LVKLRSFATESVYRIWRKSTDGPAGQGRDDHNIPESWHSHPDPGAAALCIGPERQAVRWTDMLRGRWFSLAIRRCDAIK
jgi:hypothetical protein